MLSPVVERYLYPQQLSHAQQPQQQQQCLALNKFANL
tara:strand:- start:1725 stop:1835 length:111 start_codon:yes stop_codon:yes gene_type:complete